MSEVVEVAQVLSVSLDGIQVALQVTGSFMRNGKDFLKILWNVLHREKMLGETSMRDILMRGGDLQVYQFPQEYRKQVYDALKGYGVLFAELPDLNPADKYSEVVFHAEATPRVNNLIMKLNMGQVIDIEQYLENADVEELENQREEFDQDFEDNGLKKLPPEKKEEISNRMRILNTKGNVSQEDITITKRLVIKETEDHFLTRIPYEMDKFFCIPKKDTVWINQGKTLLAKLEKNRQYEIVNSNGNSLQNLDGKTLYEKHYDEVSLATKKRAKEQDKRKQMEQRRNKKYNKQRGRIN